VSTERPPSIVKKVCDRTGTLIGVFEFAEELGSGRMYHFQFQDVTLTVLSPQKFTFEVGEKVGLKMDSQHVHIFDGENGLRLTSEEVERKQVVLNAS
jgi:ABC-type sugar transport system ATPase subunit